MIKESMDWFKGKSTGKIWGPIYKFSLNPIHRNRWPSWPRYLDEWPYVGLNMSRSLGDSKLHAVGVSDVPDVTSIFLGEGGEGGEASPQLLGGLEDLTGSIY